ncbi:MAG: cadherin-like beta sandwich domain-containing protein, partial [Anaeroplasmataceae bacterium]|nr:cadherin-like beta sandwich domain-containing protein [Anaeroplasmataceae bacterium]
MKKIKGIKKILIMFLLSLALVFTIGGLKNTFQAQAAGETCTYSYVAYSKEGYLAVKNARIMSSENANSTIEEVKAILEAYEKLPSATPPQKTTKNNYFLTGAGAKFHTYYNFKQNPDGSYDNEDSSDGWEEHSRGDTSEQIYNALKAEVAAFEAKNPPLSAITPGQEIVVEIYAELSNSGQIRAVAATIDFDGAIDTSAGVTPYLNQSELTNGATQTTSGMSSTNPTIGWQYSAASGKAAAAGKVLVGALGVTTSSSGSGFTVKLVDADSNTNSGKTLFIVHATSERVNDNNGDAAANARFLETPLELQGATISSDTTLIELTVDSKSILSGAGPQYAASDEITGNSAAVFAKVKDSGTIEGTGYVYTSSPSLPASGDASAPSGSTKTVSIAAGHFDIDMSGVSAGDSVWVAFRAIASDTVAKKWYAVKVTKAKDTNCDLEAVEIKATVSGTSTSLLNETSSLTTKTEFDVYYPKGTTTLTSFTLKPTFTSPKTATVAGANATSNAVIPLSAVSNGSSVTVVVKAQDTSKTKTYTFTFHEADTAPISVKGYSGPSSNVKEVSGEKSSKKFTLSDMALGRDSFWLNVVLPTGASAELFDTNKTTSLGTITSGSNTSPISYPTAANDAASTKTVWIKVTNNGYEDWYEVEVNRPKADNDKTGITITAMGYVDANNANQTYSLPSALPASNTTNIVNTPKLTYNSKTASFKIDVPSGSKTKILNASGTDITGQTQTLTLDAGKTNLEKTFVFYVQTEYDRTQSQPLSNGTQYTIVIQEEPANGTKTLNTLEVKNSSGDTITKPTPTMSGGVTVYNYDIDTDLNGNSFTVDLAWSPATTKAYVGKTLNPSTEYNASTTYSVGDTVYVKLVAEDETTAEYRIVTTKAKSANNKITSIALTYENEDGTTQTDVFPASAFIQSTNEYDKNSVSSLVVPYAAKKIYYTVVLEDAKASLKVNNVANAQANQLSRNGTYNLTTTGTNTCTVVATAENGTAGTTYKIHIERQGAKTGDYIETITIGGVDCTVANSFNFKNGQAFNLNQRGASYSLYLPCTQSLNQVDFTINPGASATWAYVGNSGTSFSFPFTGSVSDKGIYTFTIKVVSEKNRIDNPTNPTGNTYTFKVFVGDQDHSLQSLELQDSLGNVVTGTSGTGLDLTNYSSHKTQQTAFEVPYEVDSIAVDWTTLGSFHGHVDVKYAGNSSALTAGAAKRVTITVTSEMTKEVDTSRTDLVTVYDFYVKRKDCDHDQTLKTLVVSIDGTPVGVTLETNKYTYVIDSLTAGDTVDIQATVNDSSSTITGQTGQHTITGLLDYTGKDSTKRELTYHVYVSCKCGTKTAQDYVIKLQTDEYKPNTTPGAITAMVAETKESGGLNPSYSSGTTDYEINLSNKDGDDYAKFTITKANDLSTLRFSIDGVVQSPITTDKTQIFTVSNIALGSSKEVKVWTVAEDGKTAGTVYTVTIKRAEAASTANEATMIYYNGNNQVPHFNKSDGGPYTVNIKNGKEVYFTVDLTGVKNASVKQNDNHDYASRYQFAADEFKKTFTIIVKAESGDEKNYNIIVVRDGEKSLAGLTATIDSDPTDKLDPQFSEAHKNKYTVSLTSTQKNVTLAFTPKDKNGLTTVSFIDPTGTPIALGAGTTSYTISNIQPTKNAAGVDNPLIYKVRVTVESGEHDDYIIEISKERGSDSVWIDSYSYKENSTDAAEKPLDGLSPSVTTYSYRVDRNTLYFNPTITLNDPNAKFVWPTNRTMVAGQRNAMTVKVIPASGVGSKPDGSDDETNAVYYTFNVYPCDITFDIDDIFALLSDQSGNLLDKDGTTYIDYRNNVLEITVPYGKSAQLDTYLDIKSSADNYTIFLNGNPMTSAKQSLKVGKNEFKIQIKSDYATAYDKANATPITGYKSDIVTVIINRDAQNDDATLKDLWITYTDADGNEQTIHCTTLPGNATFAVPYLGDGVKIVSIGATPNAQTSTVSGTGDKSLSGTGETGQTFNFTVTCTAESGKKIEYPVTIARGNIDFNKDNTIVEIIVEADGKTYLAQPDSNPETPFSADVLEYGVFKIPFSAKDYKITVVRPDGTYSTTWIDGSARPSNTLTTTITSAMRGGSKDVSVYCIAKDPEAGKGKEYMIHLEFESASTDSTLSSLKADGTTVPGFNPAVTEYTLPARPNTTEVIDIEYVTSDPKAKVSGDFGRQALKEGLNTFAVTVTAEDGSSTTYKINVIRDYPLPYLTNLGAIGEKLLDANYKTTTFDKEVYNYTTIVSYMTLYATIKAEVDNPDFVVSCSNSTVNSKTDLVRTFDVNLAEGKNEFTLTVTSKEGKTVEYNLIIKRRGLASTNTEVEFIDILQIPAFKEAYTDDERYYSYEVPNGIKTLDVKVTPAQGPTEDGDGATYKIINGRESGVLTDQNVNLRVGKNTLVILIIAEDGESTRAIVVEVTRAPMNFTVNTEAYSEYTCEKKENGEYAYKINLVDKRAADIKDYTQYIVFDEENYDSTNQYVEKPEVTVISDTSNRMCTEVIVRVYDGDEEIFVTFELESKALQGGNTIPEILQIIMPWILLAIAIIILIIILI